MTERCSICPATFSTSKLRRRNLSVILKVADQDVTKVFRAAWPRLLAKIVSDPETHYACK
jgi:hypothetical protein